MKKSSILLTGVLVLAMLVLSAFSAFAETQPAATDPAPSVVVTDPVDTTSATTPSTVPATGSTDPTDSTDSTGATEPTTEATEPVTEYTRPTEYDEDNQPNTYSDYVSPAPIYTPSDQDFEKNDWEEIELDIKADSNSAGVGDFSNIKNNTSKGDEKSPLLLILCIVFWCLALSCLTFVLLYKPKSAKKVPAKATAGRASQRRRDPKVSDNYNDGF